MEDKLIKVGISIGDLNGIGMEVIIKTFMDNRMLQMCTPIVYGSSKTASFHRKALGINDFSFNFIKSVDQVNTKNANLINVWEEEVNIELGKDNETGGKYALKSFDAALKDLKEGKIDVLVTAPLNKHNIPANKTKFVGHTEYLTEYFEAKDHLMMMVGDGLRIATVTGHIPLSDVSSSLTTQKIEAKANLFLKSLSEDFGIRKPKIALLGLNPHAGDKGLLGKEEESIIIPAITNLKNEGHLVYGPFGADGFFGSGNFAKFDGILSMYHDQGLVPFKTLAFENGVNFTAGLSVIRTSPDHGTAYDIAGKNIANEQSFRSAVYLAVDVFNQRNNLKEISSNPLKISFQKRER
jgi:4-hydroxythreonine-4-phosphate dehydrogenase